MPSTFEQNVNAFLACELSRSKGREVLSTLDLFSADFSAQLEASKLLSDTERRNLLARSPEALEQALQKGADVVGPQDLPSAYTEVGGWPPILFGKGGLAALQRPTVAIVGTRGATTYGKACAMKFAEALARAGVTVVSGGALGIDTAAHEGAIAAGGQTVAVIPCGIDRVYPAVNEPLFRRIEDQGMLLSPFSCGRRTQSHFPLVRNVVVAALCDAILVIEAPGRSGSIHTANQAGEMGKEVFVVPGPIDRPSFIGSHNLIRDGATLVWNPDQILEALQVEANPTLPFDEPVGPAAQILSVLSSDALAAEKIVELTGLPIHEVMSEITMLELEGRIFRDSGGYALKQ